MKEEKTIFDSYNVCSEENMKDAKENILENIFMDSDIQEMTDNFGKVVSVTREEYEKIITEDQVYNECYELNQFWFSDVKSEFTRISRGEVIAIADLGRWNGRFSGYKTFDSLEKILYTSCDFERVYLDSYNNLRKEESHHDGSNSILYRYWKEGITEKQKENFLDKIYKGNCTTRDISRYTSKIGNDVAEVYGW